MVSSVELDKWFLKRREICQFKAGLFVILPSSSLFCAITVSVHTLLLPYHLLHTVLPPLWQLPFSACHAGGWLEYGHLRHQSDAPGRWLHHWYSPENDANYFMWSRQYKRVNQETSPASLWQTFLWHISYFRRKVAATGNRSFTI